MGRASTKPDLLKAGNEQFEKLWNLIDLLAEDKQTAAFHFNDNFNKKEAHWKRDKNLRDVLIHLYEWHQLLINWIEVNQKGEKKPFLPEPYNWRTYGQMNVEFWNNHQSTSYTDARKMLYSSHKQVMDIIETFTNEELFGINYFDWTGTSTLGAYCVSNTSSHYDWAMKKIKYFLLSK